MIDGRMITPFPTASALTSGCGHTPTGEMPYGYLPGGHVGAFGPSPRARRCLRAEPRTRHRGAHLLGAPASANETQPS